MRWWKHLPGYRGPSHLGFQDTTLTGYTGSPFSGMEDDYLSGRISAGSRPGSVLVSVQLPSSAKANRWRDLRGD